MTFIKIDAFGDTNVGLIRKNNEDYLTFFEPGDASVLEQFGRLYIVADGVGGAATGEVASKFAALKVLHTYYSQPKLLPWQRIKVGMKHANEALVAYIRQNAQARMATTMTAAAVNGDQMTIVNVGDSRAYLLRDGDIRQITQDHNLVNEMIRNGVLTEEQAKTAKVKNQLTSSLGGHEVFKADVFVEQLLPGDRLLLCSDGFCRYAEELDIVKKFMQTGTPEQIVANCIQFARNSGGQDNITVIAMEIGDLLDETPDGYDQGSRPDPVDLREVVSNPLTLEARSPAQENQMENGAAEGATQVLGAFQPDLSVPEIPVREAYAVPGINMAADDSDLMDTDNLGEKTQAGSSGAYLLDEENGTTSVTSQELRTVSSQSAHVPAEAPQASPPAVSSAKTNNRVLSVMVVFSAVIVLILLILAGLFGVRYLRSKQAAATDAAAKPVIVVNNEEAADPNNGQASASTETPSPTEAPTDAPTEEPAAETAQVVLSDTLGECIYEVQIDETLSSILTAFGVDYLDTMDYAQRKCKAGTDPLLCEDAVVIADHNEINLGEYLVIPDIDRTACEDNNGIWLIN